MPGGEVVVAHRGKKVMGNVVIIAQRRYREALQKIGIDMPGSGDIVASLDAEVLDQRKPGSIWISCHKVWHLKGFA